MALTTPFAQNGDKKAIPQSTSDGSVSFDNGFGSFYALPPEEGGLFIDRAQFNQLMYDTTSAVIENNSNISNIQNTINQVISSDVTPIGVYKNVENKTIGTNGDFKTIQEAFTYVQTHQKRSLNQQITLTLLENFNQDLYFRGAWYPYLQINCNGFVLANKLTMDLSCFKFNDLKLNNRMVVSSSIMWIMGNTNIKYQTNDYPNGAITALLNSLISLSGNINLSSTASRTGIAARGSAIISLSSGAVVTQTSGARCFNVIGGGIIQLENGINLTGVTISKASQAANQITNNGLIIGNYYSI